MSNEKPAVAAAPMQSLAALFDKLIDGTIIAGNLKNDAAIARALKVTPPEISKARHGRIHVSPTLILKLHETFDIPVKEIRSHIKDMPA